jgi:hypothetical protein
MPHRRAVLFIFITILIDSIGFGIIIPTSSMRSRSSSAPR